MSKKSQAKIQQDIERYKQHSKQLAIEKDMWWLSHGELLVQDKDKNRYLYIDYIERFDSEETWFFVDGAGKKYYLGTDPNEEHGYLEVTGFWEHDCEELKMEREDLQIVDDPELFQKIMAEFRWMWPVDWYDFSGGR